jgi:serine/threonine protein kinase/ABC-type sugar transport system substrate-binding protein
MLPSNLTGRKIKDFVIEERIGRGGTAVVYRAKQTTFNRYVALKIIDLSPHLAEPDEFRMRFLLEARLISQLEHIHILPVYDFGIVDNEFAYLAMRHLRGGSLADLLLKDPLPLDRTVEIFSQVARALGYAHSRNVVHRDLKPSNILLDDTGNAFLTDFGFARIAEEAVDLTKSGIIVGTPAYVSPEQVRGDTLDHRSDIYSLGVILYQMLTGRVPFELGDSGIIALLQKHVDQPPPPPSQYNPDITPDMEAVVLRALHKNPTQRFASADDMVEAFNLATGRRDSGISRPSYRRIAPIITPQPFKARLRGRRRWWLAGALVALSLLIAGAVLLNRPTTPPPLVVQMTRGARGTLEDVTPTEDEINRAIAQLGETGFVASITCTTETILQAQRTREMGEMLEAMGLRYRIYDSNNDFYDQLRFIEQARLDGAKAFIVCPLDTAPLIETLNSIAEAQMPIAFPTLFNWDYGVKLDSNSYDIGVTAGEFAGQIVRDEYGGEARVAILTFVGFPAADARADGMEDGLRRYAPNAEVIGRFSSFTRDEGRRAVEALLASGETFDGLLVLSDSVAQGAVDALEAANIPRDQVFIISANAEPIVQELIRDGRYVRGSVDINRELGSRLIAYAIVKLLAGSEVPERLNVPTGVMITRENLNVQAVN